MSSFSGTSSLASDAMRATMATLARNQSATRSPAKSKDWTPRNTIIFGLNSTTSDTTWSPTRGIVFGGCTPGTPSPPPRSVRRYSSVSVATYEKELSLHSDAEDSYVLATSFSSSENIPSPSGSPSGSSAISEDLATEEKEEDVPLTYHIPKADFQKAKDAIPESQDSYWSHRLYTGDDEQKPKVHYCKSKHTTERVLQNYFLDKKILGFDIEWQPSATSKMGIKKNVALIQLACEERIALFHIALFPKDTVEDLVSPAFKQLMEDEDVTKVGVAIKGDCTRLKTHLQINSRGIFELSHLYKLVKYSPTGTTSLINKRLVSLASQVEEHLELPLYKGDDVRGSDWTKELNYEQIAYAAADSYAGFMLYSVLESKRKALSPTPPRPYHAELNLPIRLASGALISTVDEAPALPEDSFLANTPTAKSGRPPTTKQTSSSAASRDITIEQETDPTPQARTRPPKFIAAEEWARSYRSAHPTAVYTKANPRTAASFPQLRAYALWHVEDLEVDEMVGLLGIKEGTAVGYIMEAVRQERLAFEEEKLKKLTEKVPQGQRDVWRIRVVVGLLGTGKSKGLTWEDAAE